jgi:type IV secretion system protein VirB9
VIRLHTPASSAGFRDPRHGARHRCELLPICLWLLVAAWIASAAGAAAPDPRLRTMLYSADQVYRWPALVGYEIDLQFEAGETFVGLGAGDLDGLAFRAQANHLFIKPKAPNVHTNLTVLTSRRIYHFDYRTLPPQSDPAEIDVVYALRFAYPAPPSTPSSPAPVAALTPQQLLSKPSALTQRNADYWYCGAPELQPVAAWDDGVHTHLHFGARSELPAVFVRNDDNSESLVNFTVVDDEVIIHRVVRRLILRRGKLAGCIVNRGFVGGGESLSLGTVSPRVERRRRGAGDESVP